MRVIACAHACLVACVAPVACVPLRADLRYHFGRTELYPLAVSQSSHGAHENPSLLWKEGSKQMFHRQHTLTAKDIARWTTIGPAAGDFGAQDCADTLERSPFLARLRFADRRALGAVGVLRSYPAGAALVEEGQRPGVGLYIILRGRVRITQRSASDGVRPLAVMEPGEMFGELALLNDEPRSATATAVTPTLAFVTPIFDLRALLRRNPEIAIALLAQMSRRIRAAEAWRIS